jgi:ferredoxin-NADP reductase/MOSC domain-containing protein YiiM
VAKVLSVNVGLPKDVSWRGKTVHTGVWKSSVPGPRRVRRLNLDGDGQGDTEGHGGEMRAVLVYQIDSYRHWEQHFHRDDFVFGQFGENLTVEGLADHEVCIGDRYRIGTAEFEVTQPRVTCYRVGLRLGAPDMASLLVAHHRPGFYFRVLTEGSVEAEDPIVKTATGPGALSVAEVDALLYLPGRDLDRVRDAVDIPALSPGWHQSFVELLEGAEKGEPGAVSAPGSEPGWPGFRELRVTEVVHETPEITSISLGLPDGGPLPVPRPGQYLTLRIAGAGTPPPVRTYSLSSDPHSTTYRISVKREPYGRVSGYLQDRLQPGTSIEAASARGEFVLESGTGAVLLISAGIGVTPVLAMLHALADEASRRDIWWLHAARRPRDQALGAEAHRLLTMLPRAHERVFYSAPGDGELLGPEAIGGRMTVDRLTELGIPTGAMAYVCGPPAFMEDVRRALGTLGIEPDRVRTELFGALPSTTPGIVNQRRVAPHPPPGERGAGPLVTFARSGLSVPFGGSWANLLDFADACDVPTRWSCRTGVCHTCETPVLAGEVRYRPDPLEPPTRGCVLVCCSHPTTDVVLDL